MTKKISFEKLKLLKSMTSSERARLNAGMKRGETRMRNELTTLKKQHLELKREKDEIQKENYIFRIQNALLFKIIKENLGERND